MRVLNKVISFRELSCYARPVIDEVRSPVRQALARSISRESSLGHTLLVTAENDDGLRRTPNPGGITRTRKTGGFRTTFWPPRDSRTLSGISARLCTAWWGRLGIDACCGVNRIPSGGKRGRL